MSDSSSPVHNAASPGADETMSALFAQLVMQQANMAMMLLGKTSNPQTGETVKDLDAARLFIDELEMLEVKTKGNLTNDESALLKQTLMSLRLAFVEAVETTEAKPAPALQPKAQPETAGAVPAPESASAPAPEEEHRKKFTKKY